MKRIPYMLIIGENETISQTVGVRRKGKGDLGVMNIDEFKILFENEIETKS